MTRTTIYVDGYNLYYARLKRTPYKWLDLAALRMIREDVPRVRVGLVMLAQSQLAHNVPSKRKPASKPAHW